MTGRGPAVVRLAASAVLGALLFAVSEGGATAVAPWAFTAVMAGLWGLTARRTARPSGALLAAGAVTDLVVVSVLVAATGGIHSPLVLLFVITILLAASQTGPRGTLAVALGATAALAMVGAAFPAEGASRAEVRSQVAVLGAAFVLLGVLAAVLGERNRRSRAEVREVARELHRMRLTTDRILEHMPIGIVTASADGCVARANRAARELLGLAESDPLVGEDLGTVLAGIAPPLVTALEAVVLTGKWAVREEVVMQRSSGERPIGVSFVPFVAEDGTLDGVLVTLTDLAHVRRMEREMQRSGQLAALGGLAADVAHEIRNPLASISGAAQVLQADPGRDEDERELMELIVSESQRLNRIIEGVLDYTRDHSMSRRIHDVSQTAREVVRLVRHDKALTVGKTIVLEFPPDQDFRAEVEENGLKQVFLNLIRNAFEAMSVGGILRVTGEAHDGRIYVVFRDTGTGIPPQELEDVFKPFHTSKGGGTGLGLSIASRIVEGNGGTIQVKSTPGIGTAFTVELPAVGADGGSKPPADRPMNPSNTLQPAEATSGWPKNES